MSLRFPRLLVFFSLSFFSILTVRGAELRVCAEPDNLPFSSAEEAGFENRIARLLAEDLGLELRYTWAPQRRAFVRKTLGEGLCDVWMGVPAGFERVLTTRPYYRSTYVFVTRTISDVDFQNDKIKTLRIGVQLPGNDLAATPAGHALAAHGAVQNVVGYTVYGERPAAERIVDAIAEGGLDAGVVWGPAVGWFAAQRKLFVHEAQAPADVAAPFRFAISVGVRKDARPLRDALDAALERQKDRVQTILRDYAVPLVP
jgi:mxaJ protein